MLQRAENKMGVKPVGRLLISMGLPIMLSMLIQALYNVVDSIFVARFSETALTAVSLAFPIQLLMISVAVGTSIGVNSLLSRRLGERRFGDANVTAMNGLFLSVVVWILFAIAGIGITPWFFQFFTKDAVIVAYGQQYLSICTIVSLGLFAEVICERIMQATGDTIHPMLTQGIGAIINIILDPIMIFGLLGFPRMGVAGAAWATVIGQTVAMLVALYFVLRKTSEVQLVFKGFKPDFKVIREIFQVGFPSIVMQSVGSVMTVGMNMILIAFSATAVSVFGVYFKLQSFIFMPVFGLTSAMIPIIGYNYGARKPQRIAKAIKAGLSIAALIMCCGLLLFQVAPGFLLELFNASDDMLAIGTRALRAISLCFPLAAVGIVFGSFFQAIGKGAYSLFISLIRQLLCLLPSAFVLSRLGGLDAVWYSFLIAETVSLVFSIVMFRRTYRKKITTLVSPDGDTLPNKAEMPALTGE
ncbi:MAG: MATE family efflux transporter [Sphaerochaetaceae bacterium]